MLSLSLTFCMIHSSFVRFRPFDSHSQGPCADPYYAVRIQELMRSSEQQERSSARRGQQPPPPTRAPTLPSRLRDRRPTPLYWDLQRTPPSEVRSASAATPAANIPGSSGVDAQSLSERLQELSMGDADSRRASNAEQLDTTPPYDEAIRRPKRYERRYSRYEPRSRLPPLSDTSLGGWARNPNHQHAPELRLGNLKAGQYRPVETSGGRVAIRRGAMLPS